MLEKNMPQPGDRIVYSDHKTGLVTTSNIVERLISKVTGNPVYRVMSGDWVPVENTIGIFPPELPEGDIDHDDEDRRAYREELCHRPKASEY